MSSASSLYDSIPLGHSLLYYKCRHNVYTLFLFLLLDLVPVPVLCIELWSVSLPLNKNPLYYTQF